MFDNNYSNNGIIELIDICVSEISKVTNASYKCVQIYDLTKA